MKVADADLPRRGEEAQEPKPHGVGERLQEPMEPGQAIGRARSQRPHGVGGRGEGSGAGGRFSLRS